MRRSLFLFHYYAVIIKPQSLNTACTLPVRIQDNGVRFKMPQIIVQGESRVLAAVTGRTGYAKARKKADILAAEHGLRVADMPMAIQAMANPEVREAIMRAGIDTNTVECHGQRYPYGRFYEVWHSAGSLVTPKGLEKAVSESYDNALCWIPDAERRAHHYGFAPIDDDEWYAVGKGRYNGLEVPRLHIEDVRKGNVPAPGTPYTSFVPLDRDEYNINPSGELTLPDFMEDDRVLMVAGSPELREALAEMFFASKGWTPIEALAKMFGIKPKIESHHRIGYVGFDANIGRPVRFNGKRGIGGSNLFHVGCFAAVAASQRIVLPKLEQTLAVSKIFT